MLPCPASVVAVNDLCIRRALIIDRHDQPPRISAVLYLQPAPGTEDIIPGTFPLYHAGNDFVRMPAGAAVIAVKLHDIAGVVHLQLRVLVEYLHRYFHRPCALVFGVLGHGQQRSVPAKLILCCEAVRRQPAQRQVRIADGRAHRLVRPGRPVQMVDRVTAVFVRRAVDIRSVVKTAPVCVFVDIPRLPVGVPLPVLVGKQKIFFAPDRTEAVPPGHAAHLGAAGRIGQVLEQASVPGPGVGKQQDAPAAQSILNDHRVDERCGSLAVPVFIRIVQHVHRIRHERILPALHRPVSGRVGLARKCAEPVASPA